MRTRWLQKTHSVWDETSDAGVQSADVLAEPALGQVPLEEAGDGSGATWHGGLRGQPCGLGTPASNQG